MWFNLPYDNSKVTVELWELIQSGFDIWKDFEFDPVPKASYPIYDEDRLRRVIENRYYFRQIGQETPERFRKMFQARLREVWIYYAQMYESAQLMADVEDPFEAYNLTETYSEQSESEGSSEFSNTSERSSETDGTTSETVDGSETRSGSSDTLVKFSDTPQGTVENLADHLTNATQTDGTTSETVENDTTTTGTASGSSTETGTDEGTESNTESGTKTYTMTRKGNIGVQPLGKEVEALRASYIKIDKMVADELADLFLMVY